jgi:hypothetical protein
MRHRLRPPTAANGGPPRRTKPDGGASSCRRSLTSAAHVTPYATSSAMSERVVVAVNVPDSRSAGAVSVQAAIATCVVRNPPWKVGAAGLLRLSRGVQLREA